jgi:hypothetical protein
MNSQCEFGETWRLRRRRRRRRQRLQVEFDQVFFTLCCSSVYFRY